MTLIHILAITALVLVVAAVIAVNVWSRRNRAEPNPLETEWDSAIK